MTAPAVRVPAAAGDRAPTTARLVGPDVTRAVALIGVVVMNYHGYLNGSDAVAGDDAGFAVRLFDPRSGVLSTRFASTFMVVAGVGVTLLTSRSRSSGDRAAVTADRWRLVRRAMVLYWFGFLLDWIWPGTILFFYGAAFLLAALVFTLPTRWLAVIGAACAIAAAGIHWWAVDRSVDGSGVDWLLAPATLSTESPRGLVFDTFVNGTHPMLPWFGFVCLGMIVGRTLPSTPGSERVHPLAWAAVGASATAVTYVINHVATSARAGDRVAVAVLSTRPFDRGLLYTVGAAGTALAAFGLISWLAEHHPTSPVVQTLARAGQMTLTIYVLHVLVFNLVVDWLGWLGGNGLGVALLFAAVFWAVAIAASSWWRRVVGPGPLEIVYRRFGG